jgi:hypothetical protein
MVWRQHLMGLCAVLGLGALLALPAAADQINCSTDSLGVIHITNSASPREKTDPAPVAASPSSGRDKEDKLRILKERRGQLPSAPGPDMKPGP